MFVAEVVHRSGTLVRWLLDNELVDEITLLVCPVVVGQGTRLFPDNGRDLALDPVESRAFPKGITLQVHRPAGPPAVCNRLKHGRRRSFTTPGTRNVH